ncbi:MAG: hypothetical protein EOS78_33515, partial [Mesorhizobium sp.]
KEHSVKHALDEEGICSLFQRDLEQQRDHGSASIALAGEAMGKTAEDNFRIEVWDRDEQALSETISRSPDST